jgi:hypothetical protein
MEKGTKTLLAIGAVGVVAYLLLNKKKKKAQIASDSQGAGEDAAGGATNNGYPLNLLGAYESADPYAGLLIYRGENLPTNDEAAQLFSDAPEVPSDLAHRFQKWVNAFNSIVDPTLPPLDDDGVYGPVTAKAVMRVLHTAFAATGSDSIDLSPEKFPYLSAYQNLMTTENVQTKIFFRIHTPQSYSNILVGFMDKCDFELMLKSLTLSEDDVSALRSVASNMSAYCEYFQGACKDNIYIGYEDAWKNGGEDVWNYVIPTNIGS